MKMNYGHFRLPDWMRGIVRAIDREGARIGDEITYIGKDDGVVRRVTITEERKYRIWEEQARQIGIELENEIDEIDDLSERVAEEADRHVPYGTYERWSLFTQGQLWDMELFEAGLRTAMEDPYDESRLPAYLLYFRAEELIYGQIGQ